MSVFAAAKSFLAGMTSQTGKASARMFSDEQLIRTIKRTTYLAWGTAATVVAMIFLIVLKPAPVQMDAAREFATMQRVQFFSTNFLTVWLTGGERDAPTVKEMVSDVSVLPAKWGTEPVEIADINVADLDRIVDGSKTEWWVTLGVTVVPPASAAPQRVYYLVTVIEQDESLRALTLPRIVEHSRPAVNVMADVDSPVSITSSLGTAVAQFSSAYFTAGEGTLGRYVSADFDGTPIASSPYTSADVMAIRSKGSIIVDEHEVGTPVRLIVTVRAGLSLTTFHTMDVPMTAHRTDNGTWLIDSVDTLVPVVDQMLPAN
ncbi:conjugal transfer protein [Rhodococcus pyridinivorans]|uniref:conjugal transfer protein n=1 Tax=Rhodococcus pyridinivorans TaxID=103816 RepID=UPI002658CFDA|nr:conjugal transfer protein [Rhodococcus pyridinivorans]